MLPMPAGIDYKESNEIGTYFAYVRHEIMVNTWSYHAANRSIKVIPIISEQHSDFRGELGELAEAAYLDQFIASVANGHKRISKLLDLVEEHNDILKNKFWKSWTSYIVELIKMMEEAPISIQKTHVLEGFYYAYNLQHNRLTQRIGVKEFAHVIGWTQSQLAAFKSKGNNLPQPVDILGATPLWTIGQAEHFLRIQQTKAESKSRGDWTSIKPQKFDWQVVSLVPVIESEDPAEVVYEINDNAVRYYSYSHVSLRLYQPYEEIEEIGNFLIKRLKFPADTHYHVGHFALINRIMDKAEYHLNKARELFESFIPDDFEGKIHEDCSSYFLCYYFLSYIHANRGEKETAYALIEQAQNHVAVEHQPELNFEEELQYLEEHSAEEYAMWIEERDLHAVPGDHTPEFPQIGSLIENVSEKNSLLKNGVRRSRELYKHGVMVYYGWTKVEVNYVMTFGRQQNEPVSMNAFDLPAERITVHQLIRDGNDYIMITDPNRPKHIFFLGLSLEEVTDLVSSWGRPLQETAPCRS